MTRALKTLLLVIFWGFTFSSCHICALACAEAPVSRSHSCCDETQEHSSKDKACSDNCYLQTATLTSHDSLLSIPAYLPLDIQFVTYHLENLHKGQVLEANTTVIEDLHSSPRSLFVSTLLSSPNAPPKA